MTILIFQIRILFHVTVYTLSKNIVKVLDTLEYKGLKSFRFKEKWAFFQKSNIQLLEIGSKTDLKELF